MGTGKRWTRDELLIALNVYRKLTFGQLDARNPVIVAVAEKLGRPPGSLAMKLSNLASLDPTLKKRGIRGLPGASNLDREIWNEFQANTELLGAQSEDSFRSLFALQGTDEIEVVPRVGVRILRSQNVRIPDGPTEQNAQVKVRRGQQFFRQMILNAFDGRCCVTRIPVREFLVASHILPWGAFPAERLNPENGLCLSRLLDAAFDKGLVGFDDNYQLRLSRELRSYFPHPALEQDFVPYAGKPIFIPADASPPNRDFLQYHLKNIFKGD